MSIPDVENIHGAPAAFAEVEARQHLITSLGPNQLHDPDTSLAYLHQVYGLRGIAEHTVKYSMARRIRTETFEPGHMPESTRFVAVGSAQQTGSEARVEANILTRALFDHSRGLAVIADAWGNREDAAMIAETATRATLQAVGANRAIPSLGTLLNATRHIDQAVGEVGDTIKESEKRVIDARTSLTVAQVLENGQLAYSHAGDTRLYIIGPNGSCVQITGDQYDANEPNEITNHYSGKSLTDRHARAKDDSGVIDLPRGRSAIILTSAQLTTKETIEQAYAEQDTTDPRQAELVARHLVGERPDGTADGAALVMIVEVGTPQTYEPLPVEATKTATAQSAPTIAEPTKTPQKIGPAGRHRRVATAETTIPAADEPETTAISKPERWRSRFDVRPSTLAIRALAKWHSRNADELYQAKTKTGLLRRVGLRSGDLALAYVSGRIVWSVGRSILAAKGYISHESIGTPISSVIDTLASHGADKPPANLLPEVSIAMHHDNVTLADAHTTEVSVDHAVAETSPPGPEPAQRTAYSHDASTGRVHPRASNVTDWSRQAIHDALLKAGVPADQANKLANDQKLIDQANEAFFTDNDVQRLNDGQSYDVTGQLKIAASIADQYAPHKPEAPLPPQQIGPGASQPSVGQPSIPMPPKQPELPVPQHSHLELFKPYPSRHEVAIASGSILMLAVMPEVFGSRTGQKGYYQMKSREDRPPIRYHKYKAPKNQNRSATRPSGRRASTKS